MRAVSWRPFASYRHRSTRLALADTTAKFVPRPVQLAPSGCGAPGASTGDAPFCDDGNSGVTALPIGALRPAVLPRASRCRLPAQVQGRERRQVETQPEREIVHPILVGVHALLLAVRGAAITTGIAVEYLHPRAAFRDADPVVGARHGRRVEHAKDGRLLRAMGVTAHEREDALVGVVQV